MSSSRIFNIAYHDIAVEYGYNLYNHIKDEKKYISFDMLYNKESRELNRQLGLHKINKKTNHKNLRKN
jgi:hypothetical protein